MLIRRSRPLLVLLVLLTLCGCCSLPAAADRVLPEINNNSGFYDQQGLLTQTEQDAATAAIRDTADRLDMYVAVVLVGPETPFSSDWAVENYADEYYNHLFNPKDDVDTDGILLLINNSSKYDYISTSGAGQFYFTNDDNSNRVDGIFDDIWPSMLAGDVPAVVNDFCASITKYYNEGVPRDYYIYEPGKGYGTYDGTTVTFSEKRPKSLGYFLTISFIALLVGVVTALIVYFSVKRSYRFKKSLSPGNYVCRNESVMHISTDTFLREHTSRVARSSGGSSGGGRSGGGRSHSSGGHSHGGGGRHR